MANAKKQSQLDALMSLIESSKNFALVNYRSTKHQTLEQLRKELKKEGAALTMLKNTLFEKAVNKLSPKDETFADLRKKIFPLKDDSGLLGLGDDWSRGLRAFYRFSDKEKTLSFKAALLDKTVYATADVTKIAKLPSKAELMAKIIGSMKSPLAQFTYTLRYTMRSFVHVLHSKAQQS